LTIGVSRSIFQDHTDINQRSLISRVLEFIQSESPDPSQVQLPKDLQMSTHHLLISLPSASHFPLLPPSIRSYRPYIDITSSTSSLSGAQLSEKLRGWFQKATQDLKSAAEQWFSDLHTLKEVCEVRAWVHRWLYANTHLENSERSCIQEAVDSLVQTQVLKIWTSALDEMARAFQTALDSSLLALKEETRSDNNIGMNYFVSNTYVA